MKTNLTTKISCSSEKLWNVLTKPEFTTQYMFNCEVLSSWKIGDTIEWKGNFNGYDAYQKGKVIAFEPYQLITYSTFDPNFGLADEPDNYIHVTYALKEEDNSTLLTITNETFDGNEERMQHIKAGWEMVVPNIKKVAEAQSKNF